MLTANTATATALTIHHTALLFMKASKFVNKRLATRKPFRTNEGYRLYGPQRSFKLPLKTSAQNDSPSGLSQTAMHGTASVRSNAAFCSYPQVDLQSGKPLGRRSGSFRRT